MLRTCLTVFLLFFYGAFCVAQSGITRPNIIVVLADDLGWGDVGFNGQQRIETPHLDSMANDGMVFERCYAGSSVCAPSRAVLLTGIHTGHAHVRGLPGWAKSGYIDLSDEEVTFGEELKRIGYKTGVIGKWGLDEGGGTGMANNQGFDYFFGFKTHKEAHHYYPTYFWENEKKVPYPDNRTAEKIGLYSNDIFTEKAIQFIREHHDEPFLLYLPYTIPHYELTVPSESKVRYDTLGWPQRSMEKSHYHHDDEANVTYAAMISRLDGYIGTIRSELRKLGIADNTLIIFSSDNGPIYDDGFFGSAGPFRGKKFELYEGGLAVPWVAVWPAVIQPGSRTDIPIAFWDVLPTFCDITRITPAAQVDGKSFLPILSGKPVSAGYQSRALYWEINQPHVGPSQAIRMGKWKGIKYWGKPFELYDLGNDPGEEENIANEHPKVMAEIERLMSEIRTDNPEFPFVKKEQPLDSHKASSQTLP